ncbi:MAG: Ribose 5-phosphate isomerase rpib [Candidatus Giovannonibacteria bacterium GW2011_GWA2_44_13b]|uniref:Ribose 5-phosphate isomerase rpib n=1 Tax=Candidatus Giovannonibacteria bacterium GW2011_GWA2_44_13b TaxID=1618647 RepID=A0A0G1GYN3_9BACT|nr:MAG: Ribose 5-phosphate isomerase rpib [Candidatus Giovannonibacteria bacterium GW2011_GWA2_44_13b]
MKIYLGSDHAGFQLKEEVKEFLLKKGYSVEDKGALQYQAEDDYPDFILPVALAVVANTAENRGIIFGGSGQGEAICANRVKGVRAAVYYGGTVHIVELSREHNNSNILSLGARFLHSDEAKTAVEFWLRAKFAGGRHQRRIDKMDK